MNQGSGFFISYAHEDATYVARLVNHLRGFDLPLWSDDDLTVGARFTQEIRERIRSAFAVIVVMSPEAEVSEWVEREILEGQLRGCDFVPILLKGERLFLLACTNYFDARDGALPDEPVIRLLRDIRDARGPGADRRPSPMLSAPVARLLARTAHIPLDISLQKLWNFLEEEQIEHADIVTTSLLLQSVGRLECGWMRRADGENLSFSLLADIDTVWSKFSRGAQGFRTQLSLHQSHPVGAPAGRQRDFTSLALSVGWKSTRGDTMPRYEHFVTAKSYPVGFFPTLRNPQVERRQGWHDRWLETVMAVHLQLRKWEGRG
ncbi:MAG TPA: toll/interleukin-1 receptor domain-containing protein [Pseudonocardiaceae bacterium]